MERSKLISGIAGVMALIVIMVVFYLFKHAPESKPAQAPEAKPVAAKVAPSPTAVLLLPPPVFTKPVPRAVISYYKPQHAVIKFSTTPDNFTGTWAPYAQLCPTAWWQIDPRAITVADGTFCHLRGTQTTARLTSATLVLDCHKNDYNGRETWNIARQPNTGTITIRPLLAEGSGNAVTLIRCPQQFASLE